MDFKDVVESRYSCRAFLPDEVAPAQIDTLFALAQRSPSWSNTQPWEVHLASGDSARSFGRALTQRVLTHPPKPDLDMPAKYAGVFAQRRRETGYGLYQSLGIAREDKQARTAQLMLNYEFFGAPHVAVITSDRNQGVYGAVDCGSYVATLTMAATSLGLASIAQAAIAQYSDFVRDYLDLGDDRSVVCAVSFGHANPEHPANTFRTTRAELPEVVRHVAVRHGAGAVHA